MVMPYQDPRMLGLVPPPQATGGVKTPLHAGYVKTPDPVAQSGYFDPTALPTGLPASQPTAFNMGGVPGGSPSTGQVAGGLLASQLLGGGGLNLQNLLGSVGQYYGQEEGIKGAYEAGTAGLQMGQQLGQQAVEGSQFRPFTVTSNLANIQTTPEGSLGVQLSPAQQALQEQLLGQAQGLFGQADVDPAAAQMALYEQMRAVQRPEEERQRLALEERMLSQGRLGLSSSAYGGSSPELLAMETARQEAMARANLGARQQAMAEQAQAVGLGQGLLSSGFMPQQQALSLLEAGQIPAGLAQQGRLTGTGLQAQLGSLGLESYMQGASLANELRQQQLANTLQTVTGRQDTTGDFVGGLLGQIFGKGRTPQDAVVDLSPYELNFLSSRVGGTPPSAASAAGLARLNAMLSGDDEDLIDPKGGGQ